MPTPTSPERLINSLIGRHRKLANIYYTEILEGLNKKQNISQHAITYRGLVNDMVVMFKELRELESHKRNIVYDEMLEEVENAPGDTFKKKIQNFIKDEGTQ